MNLAPHYVGSYRVSRVVRPGRTIQVVETVDELGQRRFVKSIIATAESRSAAVELRREHEVAGAFDTSLVTRVGPLESTHGRFALLEFDAQGPVTALNSLSSSALEPLLPRIAVQAAAGLHYLHGQGWIHAALKPSCYLVDASGGTWLTDFGHACPLKPSVIFRLLRRGSRAIQSPAYTSPEHIRGQTLDERSDVYSFGCLLFHLLTGKPPFSGATPKELLQKHVKAPVPPMRSRLPDVSADVSELVAELLAKSRGERPANMDLVLKRMHSCRMFRESS